VQTRETFTFIVKHAGDQGWIVEGTLPESPYSFLMIVENKEQAASRIARALERME
jgi:hypothetical protein